MSILIILTIILSILGSGAILVGLSGLFATSRERHWDQF